MSEEAGRVKALDGDRFEIGLGGIKLVLGRAEAADLVRDLGPLVMPLNFARAFEPKPGVFYILRTPEWWPNDHDKILAETWRGVWQAAGQPRPPLLALTKDWEFDEASDEVLAKLGLQRIEAGHPVPPAQAEGQTA